MDAKHCPSAALSPEQLVGVTVATSTSFIIALHIGCLKRIGGVHQFLDEVRWQSSLSIL